MAGAALFLAGDTRFEFTDPVLADAWLPVRLVAPEAIAVFFGVLDHFPAVFSRCQIILNLIMTGKTHIRRKKIPPHLVHIRRIRVQFFIPNILMAILAGGLPVG
jgi:hypothetical protein